MSKKPNGQETINLFLKYVDEKGGESLRSQVQVAASIAQMTIYDLNNRSMGCHCECLGMNAENIKAMCANTVAPFGDKEYLEVMKKWGMVDEDGKPSV